MFFTVRLCAYMLVSVCASIQRHSRLNLPSTSIVSVLIFGSMW